MADMLVNLLELPEHETVNKKIKEYNIEVVRAIAPDKFRIIEWVKENPNINAAGECDVCFSNKPISCYVALNKGKIKFNKGLAPSFNVATTAFAVHYQWGILPPLIVLMEPAAYRGGGHRSLSYSR